MPSFWDTLSAGPISGHRLGPHLLLPRPYNNLLHRRPHPGLLQQVTTLTELRLMYQVPSHSYTGSRVHYRGTFDNTVPQSSHTLHLGLQEQLSYPGNTSNFSVKLLDTHMTKHRSYNCFMAHRCSYRWDIGGSQNCNFVSIFLILRIFSITVISASNITQIWDSVHTLCCLTDIQDLAQTMHDTSCLWTKNVLLHFDQWRRLHLNWLLIKLKDKCYQY